MSLLLELSEKLECSECGVLCEKIVYPANCFDSGCKYVYSYDEDENTYFGCLYKVFAVEVDLAGFHKLEKRKGGFGAVKVVRTPLEHCRVSVEKAYNKDQEQSCQHALAERFSQELPVNPQNWGTELAGRIRPIPHTLLDSRLLTGFLMEMGRFEILVEEALADLPPLFAERLDNVAIVVADLATPRQLEGSDSPDAHHLLGLYEGIPLTRRARGYAGALPDQISIFRIPIEEMCRNDEEIKQKVREVVMHELGHYFGMDEQMLRDIEGEDDF